MKFALVIINCLLFIKEKKQSNTNNVIYFDYLCVMWQNRKLLVSAAYIYSVIAFSLVV